MALDAVLPESSIFRCHSAQHFPDCRSMPPCPVRLPGGRFPAVEGVLAGGSARPEAAKHKPVNGLSGCAQEAGLISGYHSVLKRRIHLSEEPVGNVVPVLHGLPAAEGCGVKGVQNTVLPRAGAIGHGAAGRLNGSGGGPVPRPIPWVAG
jgi:hypothetical protein